MNQPNHELIIRNLSSKKYWDLENGFHWHSPPSRLGKILAQYELYKSICGLPGDVFELGVYKAASLIRLATFRNLIENDDSRKIVGFDAFGKFPRDSVLKNEDLSFIDKFEVNGGDGLSEEEVGNIMAMKGFSNVSLQKGNVYETLPNYLENFPATRISFLHLDLDVMEPTQYSLEALWDRLVLGGILVVDDYGTVAGATEAMDNFANRFKLKIEKLGHYSVPAFVRKS